MRRWFGCAIVVLASGLAVGIFLVLVVRHRGNQERVYAQNDLRILCQVIEQTGQAPLRAAVGGPAGGAPLGLDPTIPAGTVPHPTLLPDSRLSWVVPLLPYFPQKRQDTETLYRSLNLTSGWSSEANSGAAKTPILLLSSYANPPSVEAGSPAVTAYVGIGGVGPEAAELPYTSPRAGSFRYDARTPYSAVTDGLSYSVLFAESSNDPGPWIRGGPATVRTLDLDPTAKPVMGRGGQFGGNIPDGGYFAFVDGSVRFFSDRVSREVVVGLFTIAGGRNDPLPGVE